MSVFTICRPNICELFSITFNIETYKMSNNCIIIENSKFTLLMVVKLLLNQMLMVFILNDRHIILS